MDWVEIVVPAAHAEVDEIAALLASEVEDAAAGTEIRDGEVVFWVPPARSEAAVAAARALIGRLADAGAAVDASAIRARPAVPEAEWRDAWKRYFHVTRVGRRVVIVPSWETHDPAPGDAVVALDPGMAFGTGTHASTRLVLEELDRLAGAGPAPGAVLDVGAGSGILAIAAARLWPDARVVAIDNDPEAVTICAENCAANRVRVACSATPVGEVAGAFDLVLANIQAHVLTALRPALCDRVAPGGALVLSGLLSDQAGAVAGAYEAAGLAREVLRPDGADPSWSGVVLRRR
jgi:ribosomal protein L11 methyltransferase